MPENELEGFRQYLTEHNMSQNTIAAYLHGVKCFYSSYESLTADNVNLYKARLMDRYMPQTVNMRLRALNCFLKFRGAPLRPVRQIRLQKKTYTDHVISQADYEYLKRRLWEDAQYTFYFIICFITATGARVSELVAFQAEDVARGYRDVYSKGNRMRRLYLPSSLQRAALDWLAQENRASGPLFLSHLGRRISVPGVRAQLKAYAARYCLDPRSIYPHSFRHRFAKNFIENGGDISLLSNLLGHSSVETTRIYLRRSSAEQARIFNRVVDW